MLTWKYRFKIHLSGINKDACFKKVSKYLSSCNCFLRMFQNIGCKGGRKGRRTGGFFASHRTALHMQLLDQTYLNSTKGIQQVGVMSQTGPYPPTLMLALLYELQHFFLVHSVQLTHQVHSCQSPVDPTHPQILRHTVLLVKKHERLHFGQQTIHSNHER